MNNGFKIRNALAKHLSDATMKMLRKRVGLNHPNDGKDIIYQVHSDIFVSLLKPNSADGKALREAFEPRVMFRVKDAIAIENRHIRRPVEGKIEVSRKNAKSGDGKLTEIARTTHPVEPPEPANDMDLSDGEHAGTSTANRDLSLLNGVRDMDESIDVKRLLEIVTDDRKRLATFGPLIQISPRSPSGTYCSLAQTKATTNEYSLSHATTLFILLLFGPIAVPPLYVMFQAIREKLRPAARPQVLQMSPTETSKSATPAAAE